MNKNKTYIMTAQETNIANALTITIDALTQCIHQGISESSKLYEIAKAIGTKFELNFNQTIIIFEEALKVI